MSSERHHHHHHHGPGPITHQPHPPRHPRMKKKSLSSFDPAQHARPGIPRGLEYLSTLDAIKVYQYMDVVQGKFDFDFLKGSGYSNSNYVVAVEAAQFFLLHSPCISTAKWHFSCFQIHQVPSSPASNQENLHLSGDFS
jgi:hypothetical protein